MGDCSTIQQKIDEHILHLKLGKLSSGFTDAGLNDIPCKLGSWAYVRAGDKHNKVYQDFLISCWCRSLP